MNKHRYASGEVPQVGDVVRNIENRPPFRLGAVVRVVRLDPFGDPVTELDGGDRCGHYANRFRLVHHDLLGIDGSGVFHAEPSVSAPPEPDFACPHCGGRHFGRSIAKTIDGEIVMPETASCLDERAVGCRWRGAWPTGEGSRKIDREIAGLRSELRRQMTEAWMRIDYATADRIADLLGERRPTEHEAEDTKCSHT